MTQFKKGMQITCPNCGEESVAKLHTEMDGWTKVGEFLVCALCKTRLEEPEEPEEAVDAAPTEDSAAADLLKNFLDVDVSEKEDLIDDDGNRRFCRDCSHLLEHPFKIYCLLHKKDVNPMDDCERFERKRS